MPIDPRASADPRPEWLGTTDRHNTEYYVRSFTLMQYAIFVDFAVIIVVIIIIISFSKQILDMFKEYGPLAIIPVQEILHLNIIENKILDKLIEI